MRQITNLNFKWAFSKEACAVPETMPENWYWVNLPHTWNAIDGQDGINSFCLSSFSFEGNSPIKRKREHISMLSFVL